MPANPITNEEIDALLQAVGGATPGRSDSDRSVKVYDFASPDKFSKEQLRALELIYTSCARGLTNNLSTIFRSSVEVESEGIAETTYNDFFALLPEPASLALLSIRPLVGRVVLAIDPGLSFAMVDRLLGGPGLVLTKLRDLTEIEKGLLGRVIERIMRAIADSWNTVVHFKAELEMIIGSSLFSQVALPDDRLVLATFNLTLGKLSGKLHFGVPVTALDPVLSKLSAQQWFSAGRPANTEETTEAIRKSINKARLSLSVELGRAQVTTRDLLDLQVGDIICLEQRVNDDLDIRVDTQIKFRGQPGQVGRHLGVRVTQVAQGEE